MKTTKKLKVSSAELTDGEWLQLKHDGIAVRKDGTIFMTLTRALKHQKKK